MHVEARETAISAVASQVDSSVLRCVIKFLVEMLINPH